MYLSKPFAASWPILMLLPILLGLSIIVMNPLYPAALMLGAAVLLPLIYGSPTAACVLLIAALPAYDFSFFSFGESSEFSPVELTVLLALLSWFLQGMKDKRLVADIQSFDLPILLLIGWALVTLFWVPSFARSLHQVVKIIIGFMIYFSLVNLIKDRKAFDSVLGAWVILSMIISIIAFIYIEYYGIPASANVQIVEGEVPKLGKTVRITMFFRQPNGLAFLLSFSIIFAVIRYYFSQAKLAKGFFGAALMLMFLALAATFSRKSWIGVGLGLFILGLKHRRILWLTIGGGLAALLVLVLSDSANFSEALYNRFMSLFVDPEISISERVVAWEIGAKLFFDRPVFGNGVGSFWILAGRLGSPLLQPHNFYLYLLAELGIMGMALFLLLAANFAASLLRLALAHRDLYANFVAVALFGCLISVLFQIGFKSVGLSDPIFWGYLGLTASFLRMHNQKLDHPESVDYTHEKVALVS